MTPGLLTRDVGVVTPQDARHVALHGYVVIGGLWTHLLAESLEAEAAALLPAAQDREWQAGPPKQATASEAPLLAQLHLSLVPLARAVSGKLLVPTCGWYNFYPFEDGIWLHVDVVDSDLVILTTVLGVVGPLHLHPDLADMSQDQLDVVQNGGEWDPNCGVPVDYPRFGIVAHRGRKIPHHRPGRRLTAPAAVAALHYKSLW